MREPLLIVDGDNVAHARWRGRRGLSDLPCMRDELIQAVAGHASRVGTDAIVVLDGPGTDAMVGRTAIRYSGAVSGDTLIERLAYRFSPTHEATVVSADRVLRHVAQTGGAEVMGPRALLEQIAASERGEEHGDARRTRFQLREAVSEEVREALDRMRRGEPP
jgi:predicted RNA-binding protein with PIN domain